MAASPGELERTAHVEDERRRPLLAQGLEVPRSDRGYVGLAQIVAQDRHHVGRRRGRDRQPRHEGRTVALAEQGVLRLLLTQGRESRATDPALDILRQRYARGDISKEEFEAKKKDLT